MNAPERGLPFVSIILPCRNEERFIRACLDSVLATTYPTDRLEVLVVDGMSEDRTRAIVAEYAARAPFIRLLDNPGRIVPTSLNTGLRAASGEVILRMDAHVTYPPDYVPTLVAELRWSGADNVGGVVVTEPGADTAIARAIAIGLAHPLGVGNAYFRIGSTKRRWVDTVPFGCYHRDVFARIGGFDEALARNEDDEFNFRLRRAGGRILLIPAVTCRYYARPTLRQLARMFYQYGYYKPVVARKVGRVMTARQLVPPVCLAALAATGLLGVWSSAAQVACGALAASYGALVLGCAVPVVLRHGLRCAIAFLAVPPVIHFSYGLGYLRSLAGQPLRIAPRPLPARLAGAARRAAGAVPGPRRVSIIVPCRNEARYVGACLDSILATEVPQEQLEVLVVDGRSDDGTREIVAQYAARHPHIRLLDNPGRITPTALNTGIRAAQGEVIVRMDAHVTYPSDYLPQLLAALRESGADNVGGVVQTLPADQTPTARAIALALSHPLGVGNSYFRIGAAQPRWVDTVPFGCYHRGVFDRIGVFDEELVRNQDDEFNFRLRRHGGRILLLPSITCRYYARGSLLQLGRMFYQYGSFKPLVARKTRRIMTARQLVPALFIATLLASSVLGWWVPLARVVLASVAGAYATLVLGAAAQAAPRQGLRCALVVTVAFPVLHFSYGLGFLTGLRAFWSRTAHGLAANRAVSLSR
jgi:glycosyltransferase involved in cell wall biosynthesis